MIQIDMEMPKNCFKCIFKDNWTGCLISDLFTGNSFDERNVNCLLVEVKHDPTAKVRTKEDKHPFCDKDRHY